MNVIVISDGGNSSSTINMRGVQKYSAHNVILRQFIIQDPVELEQADLIHVHYAGIVPTAPRLHADLKSRRDKAWVGGVRGWGSIRKGFNRDGLADYMKLFDALAISSKELMQKVQTLTDWPCYLAQAGVDTEIFTPSPPPEEFKMGWCGNPWTGAKMLGRLCDLPFPYRAIGGGDALGVTVDSFVKHAEMPDFYRSISVYVSVSDNEGCPLPPFEAAASGRPVVATRVGGLPEWMPEKYLVGNHLDMIPLLEELRDDPELYAKQAKIFRNLSLKWDFRHIAKQYDSMWEEVLENAMRV